MKANKLIITISMFALVGLLSCLVVEPALAQFESHQAATETEADGHCDFICHSMHHQWHVESHDFQFGVPLVALGDFFFDTSGYVDPPTEPIFHPPHVIS